jgi:hypothetical protein
MNADVHAAFSRGSGSELIDNGIRPAKMRALISSSALAVNFFGFWAGRSPHSSLLANAMELPDGLLEVTFEEKCPTGLRGIPPNLDVFLRWESAVLGIESKFTEWMTPKKPRLAEFRQKYLANDALWERYGLPRCQAVAHAHGSGSLGFQHLDVAQLLKHALGLVACHGPSARLGYVYWDDRGTGGEAHAQELREFENLIADELGFRAWRYQKLATALSGANQKTDALEHHLSAFVARYGQD